MTERQLTAWLKKTIADCKKTYASKTPYIQVIDNKRDGVQELRVYSQKECTPLLSVKGTGKTFDQLCRMCNKYSIVLPLKRSAKPFAVIPFPATDPKL